MCTGTNSSYRKGKAGQGQDIITTLSLSLRKGSRVRGRPKTPRRVVDQWHRQAQFRNAVYLKERLGRRMANWQVHLYRHEVAITKPGRHSFVRDGAGYRTTRLNKKRRVCVTQLFKN